MAESVTIESAEVPAEGPNDAAMVEAYENQNSETSSNDNQPKSTEENQQGQDRPDWLPPKFQSPEDMAKAYSELEKKLGAGENTEQEEQETEVESSENKSNKPRIEKNEEQEQAEEVIGSEALQKYNQEFSQAGELSEESYQELQGKGIPKEMVDAYIEGQKAVAERQLGTLYETAGSEESLNEAIQWAAGSMDQGDVDAFNSAMESGNLNQMKMAVRGLMAEYTKANGSEGKRVSGSVKGGAGNTDVYTDMSQVTRDMGSKEYAESAAFRQEVQNRLSRSSVL